MKGSGKQILLRILKELSTRKISEGDLQSSTDRIRAALLIHGSTSDESFMNAKRLSWASSSHDGSVERQGLAVQDGSVFLSDFFERMLEMPGIEQFMIESYEGFSRGDYEAAIWGIWALLSSAQMFTDLLQVEATDSELEIELWIEKMIQKYYYFFNRS